MDDTISALLQQTVDNLRDTVRGAEQLQIDTICTALAILRPFVPVKVLASVSGVEVAAVRSFASDLGRPLLILEDAIQFRDEPVETWFREHFRPIDEQLSEFIDRLKPLAPENAYVASTLPQLMLEAGQLNELIELALSSSLLPSNLIERRDVELQRLQFALKASLRTERFADAAKLALKAGQETTGDTRQHTLLRDNTDLAAMFLEPGRIQEIVSRRVFGRTASSAQGGAHEKTWTGSHHAYEASLLSYLHDFQGDALSRLRMAYKWLMNWNRLSEEERRQEKVTDEDIAEIALTHFNIHGPEVCAAELRRWKPREVSYRVGRIVARRLVDQGRYSDLDELAFAASNNVCLLLAINLELRAVHRQPPKKAVERALRLVLSKHVQIKESNPLVAETVLPSITALVESASVYRLQTNDVLASVLRRYLPETPPRGLASRHSRRHFPFLRAHALQAALKGEDIQLIDLAHPELKEKFESRGTSHVSDELREFKEQIGTLLPWHTLWAENLLDPKDTSALAAASGGRSDTAEEIVEIWFDILVGRGGIDETALEQFNAWIEGLSHPLYVPTWTRLARLAVHTPNLENLAYEFIRRAFERMKDAKEDAESKAQTYVELARTILAMDQPEAKAYFSQAIEVTSRIGDEIYDRWSAMLDLADRAANPDRPCSETAYRLARCAELAYHYVYRDFLWEDTVEAIAALCPSSCFAILSRWRDRNFGRSERLIATAIHFLLARRLVDPKTAAILVGFRAHWEYGGLVKIMFAACPSHSDREKVLNFVLRYIRLDDQSSSTWERLKQATEKYDLTIPEIDPLIEHAKRRKRTLDNTNQWHGDGSTRTNKNIEIDWDTVFLDKDLHTPNGLSRAYANFRSNRRPPSYKEFFAELFKRVPTGKAAEIIRAFPDVAEFSSYDFEPFLEQLPEEWKAREAIKPAIGDAIRTLCVRYCTKIIKSRYWQPYLPLPLRLASELSGISETDLIRDVVAAIGERTEIFGAGRLFTLVGLLASHLSHDEALDALNFGLDLFDDALDESDGDGSWTLALEPPSDINTAIAGYIWAALAAPQASLRWEAAHVVRGLCVLGRQDVLNRLIKFAKDGRGGPFSDSRLHFYHLHGRQWLMIALARAAVENSAVLAPYREFFVWFALKDEPHVVIRHFAAKAALALVQSGHIEPDGGREIVAELASVNDSKLPVVSSDRYKRFYPSSDMREGERFHFNQDMTWYWFGALRTLTEIK